MALYRSIIALAHRAAAVVLVLGQILAACTGAATVADEIETLSTTPPDTEETIEEPTRLTEIDETLIRLLRESRPLAPPVSAIFRRSSPNAD